MAGLHEHFIACEANITHNLHYVHIVQQCQIQIKSIQLPQMVEIVKAEIAHYGEEATKCLHNLVAGIPCEKYFMRLQKFRPIDAVAWTYANRREWLSEDGRNGVFDNRLYALRIVQIGQIIVNVQAAGGGGDQQQ